jgi:hypothetical protein
LLANGFEHRDAVANRVLTWVGIGSSFTAKMEGEKFQNATTSQYFERRNYNIDGIEPLVSLRYLGSKNLSVEAIYKWASSKNLLGSENANVQSLSLQTDYIFPGKGSVMTKISVVHNEYNGNSDSPVAYEMLRGLQPGRNWVWEALGRHRLSKFFELELGYSGRMLNNGRVIHTGSMQARALF